MEILLSFDSRCIRLARGCWPFFVAHRTDAGASGETELVLAIPSDKEENEVKVKSQRTQKDFLASGHTIRVKSEKSEDLEHLAVINYEILEHLAVINYEDLEIMCIFAALNY